MNDRLVSGSSQHDERQWEKALRPQNFDEYIGQEELVGNLKVFSAAAAQRAEPMDHVLLSGPPGLGKTTLARIIANEMGAQLHLTSGPAIEKKGDLAGILTNMQPGDVLFIDEIHRLTPTIEENLYPAMEDYRFDIMIGEGAHARSISLDLEPFTLVGATTKTGLLTSPLRDRFGFSARLRYYSNAELERIVSRSAGMLSIDIDQKAAACIGTSARGTPRIANRLLRRVRDFAQVEHDGRITLDVAQKSLARLGVDRLGLDDFDMRLLSTLKATFEERPVGLETLAAALGEDAHTIEDVYEPYLIQEGLLMRTPRGRMLTARGKSYVDADRTSS